MRAVIRTVRVVTIVFYTLRLENLRRIILLWSSGFIVVSMVDLFFRVSDFMPKISSFYSVFILRCDVSFVHFIVIVLAVSLWCCIAPVYYP